MLQVQPGWPLGVTAQTAAAAAALAEAGGGGRGGGGGGRGGGGGGGGGSVGTHAGGPAPQCDCGQPSTLLTVRKEGPNQGRTFYKCTKGRDGGCNFFTWADEVGVGGSGGGGGGGAGRGGRGAAEVLALVEEVLAVDSSAAAALSKTAARSARSLQSDVVASADSQVIRGKLSSTQVI